MAGRISTFIHRTGSLLPGLAALALTAAAMAQSGFVGPQRIGTQSPSLDASFQQEAWLVYTYDVDPAGQIANAAIRYSNGVEAVDRHMLEQIQAQRYRPATSSGSPVKSPVGPVSYTWILDIPRTLGESFALTYDQAWTDFRAGNYDGAGELALQLGNLPGRNAFEEVKYQLLAASIASRRNDPATESRHLGRIMAFQDLADSNHFKHPYIEPPHYNLILSRVHRLQLDNNQLADAQATFHQLLQRGPGESVLDGVQSAQLDAESRFIANPDAVVRGRLSALYSGGPGTWKTGLSRQSFSLDRVDQGRVDWLYLVCGKNEQRLPFPSRRPWTVPEG
ncbi:MAG: energy transducer TonB, partial [Parahaliea sp.]